MKNKKVMIVEPNNIQRFEQGGEIEEAGEVIRPMFIGTRGLCCTKILG